MSTSNFNVIHNNLTYELKKYISAITDKYGSYMSDEQLYKLQSIENYDEIIKIHDYGSINGYANRFSINMPLSVERVFNIISKIPGYGINKKHMPYNNKNMIINDNTFITYIVHTFISGKDTETYYKDLLLHETMHYCGSGGATAIQEGINELLTRKLALEKGFRTNCCGYPKEVKLAYELQKLFGEDVINALAFQNGTAKQCEYLEATLGKGASDLYMNVSNTMESEFENKYYSHMDSYNGITGIFRKAMNYRKVDYTKVYNMLNEYQNENLLLDTRKK